MFVELQRLPTTTIEHEAMDCDKSHRGCCTRGSRSHQSKSAVPQYYLDVMLACDAGFHNLKLSSQKNAKTGTFDCCFHWFALIWSKDAKSVASKMNKKPSQKTFVRGSEDPDVSIALLPAKFQRLSTSLNMMTSQNFQLSNEGFLSKCICSSKTFTIYE